MNKMKKVVEKVIVKAQRTAKCSQRENESDNVIENKGVVNREKKDTKKEGKERASEPC